MPRADSTPPVSKDGKPSPAIAKSPTSTRNRTPKRTPPSNSTSTTGAGRAFRSTFAAASGWRARSAKSRSVSKTFPTGSSAKPATMIEHDVLVMKIQPEEGVSLRFSAKVPGPKMHIRSVSMDFNYGTGFGVVSRARIRASDRRCDARRCDTVHPLGRGRGRMGSRYADFGSLADAQRHELPQLRSRESRSGRIRCTLR